MGVCVLEVSGHLAGKAVSLAALRTSKARNTVDGQNPALLIIRNIP